MTYKELMEQARGCIGSYCKACLVCNGKACGAQMPGPGAKGAGDTAIRNYEKWQQIRVKMDTLSENTPVDTSLELFGKTFRYPFFAGPVGAVNMHYGTKYDDLSYNNLMVKTCAENGIAAFTGDGVVPEVMGYATKAIAQAGGLGVPTVKPWNKDTVKEKMALVRESGSFAVAMDVDAAGLPFLRNQTPPAGRKSVEDLREIVAMTDKPFIVKGVMTPQAAMKAKQAGAAGIVVSNHGGRVLDGCLSTAEVLPEIVDAVGGSMKILVDGGIRSGVDIFKALAIGADGVIICRPFVTAIFGGDEAGIKMYIDKLGAELEDTMEMCGAHSLKDITRDMISL